MITKTTSTTLLSQQLQVEEALYAVKATFEEALKEKLSLSRVSSPIAVLQGTGVNDDLNGIERPAAFPIKDLQDRPAEVVQSLAKWKRLRLKQYDLPPGSGIITDMKALRPDEELGPMHSIYVDQWDWEKVISPEDRKLDFLKQQVEEIYEAVLTTEAFVTRSFDLAPQLPPEVTFLHTEDLLEKYPDLSSKEREDRAAEEFGAIFLIGIGGELTDGKPHDGRAPDYDDWSTPTSKSTKGLNGDLIFWNPVLQRSFEISSMGIRVDKEALARQLKSRGAEWKKELLFHRQLLEGSLPESIGGGIGQSRLCMFLLKKRHVGEVQVSIWPEQLAAQWKEDGIELL